MFTAVVFLLVSASSPASSTAQAPPCADYTQRTVDEDRGEDVPGCLQSGGPACASLDYALSEVGNCLMVHINSSLNLTAPVHVSDVYGIVIAGDGSETVSCGLGAGIYFDKANDTSLEGLAFKECSVTHLSAVLSPAEDLFYPNVSSALFFERCLNISITNCSFTSNVGSGVTLFNSGGQVVIRNSSFVNNSLPTMDCSGQDEGCYNISVGLEIKMTYCELGVDCWIPQPQTVFNSHSRYIVEDCVFSGNNNSFSPDATESEAIMSYAVHRTLSHGGGIEIRLEGRATGNQFEIRDSKFIHNTALWGGGLEVGIGEDCSNNAVTVIGSNFSMNTALVGGAVRMGVFPPTSYDGYGYEEKNNVFTIFDCTFESNRAISAGAISYLSNAQLNNSVLTHLEITQCHFQFNHVNDSGAAVGITGWNNEIAGFPTYVEFKNCNFYNNIISFHADVTKIYGVGIVNTEHIPVKFYGNTTFINNQGSALVVSSTVVFLNDNIDFEGNWAINGAGIFLVGLAWINLSPGVRINFFNNQAYLYGGGIYSAYAIPQVHNSTRYCIFKYSNNSVSVSEWDAKIYFNNNQARVAGQSIFVSTGAGCYRDNATGIPFTDTNVFIYYSDIDNSTFKQVATPPRSIEFGSPAVDKNGTFSTSLMLGQPFHLYPISNDFFGNPTAGSALVSLICNPQYPSQCNGTTLVSDFSLVGDQLVQLNNSDSMTSFYISRAKNSTQNETIIFLLSNTLPSAMGYLHVEIAPCRLGYTFNSEDGTCDCIESDYVSCQTEEACIKYGYWIGVMGSEKESVVEHCTSSFCNYNNGQCPVGSCIRTLQSYCHLPAYDSDQLCEANRGGLLCSGCKKHYGFTFAAVQCVPEETCSAGHTVLLIFLNVLFWAMLIAILLAVIMLGFQIGSGQLYCLIYYFSILQYLTRNNYPSSFLNIVVYLFTGFLDVNPRFFGLIPICIFDADFSPLNLKLLEYMHPLFMFLAILALIVMSRRFPRLAGKMSFNGIKVLCILLYLSLTSLAQTSLGLLDFVQLDTHVRVAIEPTIPYFSPSHHLPHALVAIAVLMIIVFPFIILLLIAPSLARVRSINLTRIKPLLDEYQACYHERYRWFAGYYLACRVFVFIFSLINLGEFGSIFFLQMICIVILVIHAVIQPYREQWLNVLDSILLADLAIYSLFNGSTANVVLGGYSSAVRDVLVHSLILLPILYFLGLSVYKLNNVLEISHKIKICWSTRKRVFSEATPSNISAKQYPPPATSADEREPLLFTQTEQHPLSSSEQQQKSTNAPQHRQTTSTSHSPWYRRFSSKTRPARTSQAIPVDPMRIHELSDSSTMDDVHRRAIFTKTSVSPPK